MSEKALLEAALFISDKPLSIQELSKISGLEPGNVSKVMDELDVELSHEHRGVELFKIENNYHLKVKEVYLNQVSHLTPYADLSRAMLKVLSLAVYKKGITQSEIVKTIGNRAYDYVKELELRGLIKTERAGRSKALLLTDEFMRYFGVSSRQELLDRFRMKTGKKELKDIYASDFAAFFEKFEKNRG